MQEKVNIKLQTPLKQVHILIIIELRTQTLLQRDLRTRARNLNTPHTALDKEHADFVARNSQVDLIPLFFCVALPGD